jgi:cell division ATPase FtsA
MWRLSGCGIHPSKGLKKGVVVNLGNDGAIHSACH